MDCSLTYPAVSGIRNHIATVKGRPRPAKNQQVLRLQFHWFALTIYGIKTPITTPKTHVEAAAKPAV